MSSAKLTIKEQDRSTIVPSFDGVYAGLVVVSDRGEVNVPVLNTGREKFLARHSTPNPKLGTSMYSGLTYLTEGNKLWSVRAAHADAAYAGALVRSKVLSKPIGPLGILTEEHLIIAPVGSITQAQLDAYTFPVYTTNKLYEDTGAFVAPEVQLNASKIRVNDIEPFEVGDSISFTGESVSVLNSPNTTAGEDTPTFQVLSTSTEEVSYDMIQIDLDGESGPLVAIPGMSIRKYTLEDGPVDYPDNPVVARFAQGNGSGGMSILVSSSDYIADGDRLVFGEFNDGDIVYEYLSKSLYQETQKFITINGAVDFEDINTTTPILKVVQSEFEDRDAFLVVSANQGKWGNDISIGITPNSNYDNAFNLLVYFKGIQVENWEVSRTYELDGYQRQLNISEKINGKSAYIKIVDNPNCVDNEGNPLKPLNTDYSYWRRDSEDIFRESSVELRENLMIDHTEVKVSSLTIADGINIIPGTRVKFQLSKNLDGTFVLSKEYKVLSTNTGEGTFIVDRKIEELSINKNIYDPLGNGFISKVHYFDPNYNNSNIGVASGVKYYDIDRLNKVFYNYPVGAKFTISGQLGTLVNPGANLLTGGSLGSAVTVGDLITALRKLNNKERTPVTLFMDGGFTFPAFAQAIEELCVTHNLSHGYLSSSSASEEGINYLTQVVAYKNSLNLNTHRCSFFSGWVKFYDEFNQMEVWTSPEAYAAASQCFTTRNFAMFYPAAGWERGKVRGLGVKVQYDEGERDFLDDNRINVIRYKEGSGLVIWGNETLLTKPSPMQLRSVAMLLIVIKYGLERMLEYKHFDINSERAWIIVEGALNAFMRDDIKAKDGVYDFKVAVQDVITNTDIDNRRMPVFLGIQPTMDIKMIDVTLAIFNKSVDIDVTV